MASYRFCRSDDIPLLVEAHNRCCAVHVDGRPPLTVETFRRAIHEINLWSSSCSLAIVDGGRRQVPQARVPVLVVVGGHEVSAP